VEVKGMMGIGSGGGGMKSKKNISPIKIQSPGL
jgi:hypothetical protein